MIVLLCMLMVETKTSYFLLNDQHQAEYTAKAKYTINFTESGKRFVLSLHYNGSNSFLFVNAIKMYQFKAEDSEIKPNSLC